MFESLVDECSWIKRFLVKEGEIVQTSLVLLLPDFFVILGRRLVHGEERRY